MFGFLNFGQPHAKAPADPLFASPPDHSVRDGILSFLAAGPMGLAAEIMGREHRAAADARMREIAGQFLGPSGGQSQSGMTQGQYPGGPPAGAPLLPVNRTGMAPGSAPTLDPGVGLDAVSFGGPGNPMPMYAQDPGGGPSPAMPRPQLGPSGPPTGAPMLPGSIPSATGMSGGPAAPAGAAAPPPGGDGLPPQLKRYLAAMSAIKGDYKSSADIMQDDVAQAADGTLYSKKDGHIVGRLPHHVQVNGFNFDPDAPGAPGFIPELDKGIIPDGNGGVTPIRGYPQAQRAIAFATADAQQQAEDGHAGSIAGQREQARANFAPMTFTDPNGRPVTTTQSNFARGVGGAVGQSPSDQQYGNHIAEAAAKRYNDMQAAIPGSQAKINGYRQIASLLQGVDGGKLTPAGVEVASAANSIGIHLDKHLGNEQAAQAIVNQMAMQLRNPAGGAGMPGSMSNSDRDFLVKTTPGLVQSAAGRQQIVNFGIATEQRGIQVAQMARQWQRQAGRLDAPDKNGKTFDDYLQQWVNAHPLFGAR